MAAAPVMPTGRAAAMGARLADTARRHGIDAAGTGLVLDAFRRAMAPRERALDEAHPDYLHPARTALILMDDAGVDDPTTLAASLLVDTRPSSPGVSVPGGEMLAGLGPDVMDVARAVPVPAAPAAQAVPGGGSEPERARLLEALVTAPSAARRIALAERLDHARHLHLRDRSEWEAYHALTCAVYGPVAERESALLGRRFRWWCETFRRRFLAR